MTYRDTVEALATDAERMELLYQAAVAAGEEDVFRQAIDAGHAAAPGNLLYAAWFHRLRYSAERAQRFVVAWGWVVPLAVANGLLFWLLSDDQRFTVMLAGVGGRGERSFGPTLVLLAAPLAALFILVYLGRIGRKPLRLSLLAAGVPLAAAAYVLWAYPRAGTYPYQEQYLMLMALHLPLLAWVAVGAFLTAGRGDPANRFAVLIKSLELFVMGGLFAIAGGLFIAITTGLFAALSINLPVVVQRLLLAGGGGLIPVVATAVIYNPRMAPAEQAFADGLSRLVALLMRFMLPLTLVVLLVYLAFIPFNFREPFDNRDVLITYNAMLFAVIALLVGATPVTLADVAPRLARWLRLGICAVAALALIVSLYALAAIVYRTVLDRLTPNRLTFIGWNVINISLLALLLRHQARSRAGEWLPQLWRAYSSGTVAYAVWTVAMIVALPWLFGIDRAAIEALPPAVQRIVYENPDPILLKCAASPHIYLLEDGEKRWVDSIETFTDRGYLWRDVRSVTCADLRSIADGVPIPADAGPPPQP